MCDICSSYAAGNINKSDYDEHIQKKESARDEKRKDKKRASDGEFHLVTMDVQKVLLSPMLNASALYYKTKLIVHNFTVYDLTTHVVTCYLFDETEAELKASSFATCIIKFFEDHYKDDLPIIVYSDGCTSQNRNAFLSSALLHYACKHNKIIIQKFLEKGHTQMEVDSVHAMIEKKVRGKSIYVPMDYVTISKEARSTPSPYEVVYMYHNDFIDYGGLRCNIRPGKDKGDPVVTDLRQIKYNLDCSIQYKLTHCQEWTAMPRKFCIDKNFSFPKLYQHRIPLTSRKFQDLKDVLHVIPECHHEFYNSLPQNNK
jgi:hypothetical protein